MAGTTRVIKTTFGALAAVLVFCSFVYVVQSFAQQTNVAAVESPAQKYYNEGAVYEKKNDYKGALKMFEAAIKADPSFVAAYYSAANCAINTGDFEKAKEYAEAALKLNPTSIYGHFNLATAYFNLKKYDLAKENYKAVLSGCVTEKCPKDIIEMTDKQMEALK